MPFVCIAPAKKVCRSGLPSTWMQVSGGGSGGPSSAGLDVSEAASAIACMAARWMRGKQFAVPVPPAVAVGVQFVPDGDSPPAPVVLNMPLLTSLPSDTRSGQAPLARNSSISCLTYLYISPASGGTPAMSSTVFPAQLPGVSDVLSPE